MASSAKKKSEKKKDFQKAKLKVGKTKAKASNVTSTKFAAKSIVLKQQSLHADAPSVASLINHHLALVSSRQESQRRESLAALANDLTFREGSDRSVATATIISKVRSCLIDGSKSIREQALRVLKALRPTEVAYNVPAILIYVHIGMVHLAADVRMSSLNVLEWLVQTIPEATVSCAGGWIKTLTTFMTLLKWQAPLVNGATGWSGVSQAPAGHGLADDKLKSRQIAVLAAVLNAGVRIYASPEIGQTGSFPLWNRDHHCIGRRPNPFANLALFGAAIDENDAIHDDTVSRRESFEGRLQDSLRFGMQQVKKEGGETGRAVALLNKVLVEHDLK